MDCDKRITHVCVLGNAGIETKIFLKMIPKKNCEAIIERTCINVGGTGAHISSALSSLGLRVDIITQIGKDSNGERVLSELRTAGVNLSYALISNAPTISFISIIDSTLNRIFLIKPVKWNEKAIAMKLFEAVKRSDLLIVCPVAPSLSMKAAKLAKGVGKTVIISPEAAFVGKPQKWIKKFFAFADMIFLNENELCFYTNSTNLQEALIHPAFKDEQTIVVTRGRKGCIVISKGEMIRERMERRKIIDPSGAGAEFLAGFLWSLTKDYDLRKAARMGCLGGLTACAREELLEKVYLLKKYLVNGDVRL